MKSLFTQAFPPTLKDYYDSKIAALTFDASNTATGTDTVEINGNSGIAEFTISVLADNSRILYINNSNITYTDQPIFLSLGYNYDSADGTPQIIGYQTFEGQIQVQIKNINPTNDSNSSLFISFQVLS